MTRVHASRIFVQLKNNGAIFSAGKVSVLESPELDADLHDLDRNALIEEVKRLRAGIRGHRDASGHELCWFQPRLWSLLPEPLRPEIKVPDWPRFMAGCVSFRSSLDREASTAPRTEEHYSPED